VDEIKIDDLNTTPELPFFARFLEGQMEDLSDAEANEIAGGKIRIGLPIDGFITNKYPSDLEDGHGGDMPMTKKYPSDREDHHGGGIVTTQKFPSDGEDNHGGIAMTLKYPSDNEEGATAG
jgi:Serine endopeptidase inhibitors